MSLRFGKEMEKMSLSKFVLTYSLIKKLKKGKLLLFLVFIIALFLRVFNLSSLPANFHQDEVFSTFVGRFTLLHFKDPYGNLFPLLYFDWFGDYPPIFPMYFSGFSTFIFGVSEFAARLPSALIGSLVIFPTYLFTKLLFDNRRIALFSSFFVCILPWHIVLSRASGEIIIGITILIFALYLLFKSAFENKYILALISCLFFISTYFIYPSFRLLVPLLLLPLPLIFFKAKLKYLLLLILIICISLTFAITSTDWGKGRFIQTSILTNPTVAFSVKNNNIALSSDEDNVFTARVFNNKIVGYSKLLLDQYFSYYSPDYLFLHGGYPLWYHVRDNGLLYLTFLIFYFGLFFPRLKNFYKSYVLYIFYLLLIAAIPAALTVDDVPNIKRSTFLVIPLVILAGIGLENIIISIKKYSKLFVIFIVCIALFLSLEFIFFWHQYAQHNASYKSILRNDGDKEASIYLSANRHKYEKVFAPSSLILYYLFFNNDFNTRTFAKGMIIKQVDNIEFVNSNDPCFVEKLDINNNVKNILYIENGDCSLPNNLSVTKLIVRKDSTKAYQFLEKKK